MPRSPLGNGVITAPVTAVPRANEGLPDLADMAEQICAVTFIDGKTAGVFAASFSVLENRLGVSEQTLNLALATGIDRGWLRQRSSNLVELTASGIYVAKLTLKLPT